MSVGKFCWISPRGVTHAGVCVSGVAHFCHENNRRLEFVLRVAPSELKTYWLYCLPSAFLRVLCGKIHGGELGGELVFW